MQMLCTLPVLFIINKLLDMLNTLTKPRFQTFVKIFQGPTDRPTRLVLEAPPRSLKICETLPKFSFDVSYTNELNM